MNIPDDVWKYIFSFIKFGVSCLKPTEVKHKELCLVSKQWQDILDNNMFYIDDYILSFNASINFLRKNKNQYNFITICSSRKTSEEFHEEFINRNIS